MYSVWFLLYVRYFDILIIDTPYMTDLSLIHTYLYCLR